MNKQVNQIQNKGRAFVMKKCTTCGGSYGAENFCRTKSLFYPDGYMPICNDCVRDRLVENDFNWAIVDKICQLADIPFVPAEFERLREINGNNVFPIYAKVFLSQEYDDIGWGDYHKAFRELKESGQIEDELPELREEKIRKLKEKWGANYDEEALNYLENLYNGLLSTQNVNGALQADQALKICKISYEVDCRIREGVDFDKLLASYDKLVKSAEFTPKNVKNINDFDTCGELIKWMEKNGWKNPFYDSVTRDVVDETIKNIQNFNQRLYTNESGIGDEITHRIEMLKTAKQLESGENHYGLETEYDLDSYDNDGFNELFNDDEEFNVSLED